MSKDLKPLKEYNKNFLKKRAEEKEKPNYNGLACPKCGSELEDSGNQLLMSNPPQIRVKCSNNDCNFKGTRFI